jgi:hypothetical protein
MVTQGNRNRKKKSNNQIWRKDRIAIHRRKRMISERVKMLALGSSDSRLQDLEAQACSLG